MSGLLVEAKLSLPSPRSDVVPRPRLSDRLARGLADDRGRLVLVSAPAGFGKTTLVATWLSAHTSEGVAVAWVSLDERDQDPSAFWAYVLTALDRALPGIAAGALPLQRGQEPSEDLLAGLLNELSVLPGELVLVLDDYHLADGPGIRPGMTFFVDRLPPQVRLVISTRADPNLPLARLRAHGELLEIRAADLRFTIDEAAGYLEGATGLDLTAADVAALDQRTEGWVAAVQLAALSLRGRDDASQFIAGFTGDDRYVVDYLVEEVLDRQPEPVRRFLLETSILDQLTGPLCDAVTGTGGGRAMLERLERSNLFVVPLDDRRRWYRYHHLFGDLLRSRLGDEHEHAGELHRRASHWYDEAGDPVAAVRHALAAGDHDRAADLIELAVPDLLRSRQEVTLRQWVHDLPDAVVDRRPVLAMGFVAALMQSNDFDDVTRRLRQIERTLDRRGAAKKPLDGDPTEIVVLDDKELARVPGGIELYRAALALIGGDPVGTLDHAGRAVALAPAHDDLTRASAAALVGLASFATGDLQAAHQGYTAAADGLRRLGHLSDVLGCTITLADIETTQGLLRQAQRTYERALDLAARPGMRGVADMHTGLAQIAIERGDLATATEHLRRGDQLGAAAALPQNPWRWRATMALLRQAQGDHETAIGLLTEAEGVYVADFQPNIRPLPAMRARMHAAYGDALPALHWAHEHGVRVDDDLTYLREYEHVTLARVLLAEHRSTSSSRVLGDAVTLLSRLRAAAEAGGRTGTVIETLALLALAHRARSHDAAATHEALAALETALVLAEPEGYLRVFTGEGEPMAALLSTLAGRRPEWAYARRLLDATGRRAPDQATSRGRAAVQQQALVEPFTDRERDVMRLLASDLDGPSIARELVLSLNTVRTHTKNIYAKLGVGNRRAAVSRAHQLDLLSGRERR